MHPHPAALEPQVELREGGSSAVAFEACENGLTHAGRVAGRASSAHRVDRSSKHLGLDLPRRRSDLPFVDPAKSLLLEHTLERSFELGILEAGQRCDGLAGIGGLDATTAHHRSATEFVPLVA